MSLLSNLIPRNHPRLSSYSKEQLDDADKALRAKGLLKTPKISWIILPFAFIIPYIMEILKQQKIFNFKEDSLIFLALALIPIFIAVKIKENRFLSLVIDHIEHKKI